jgi:hypothetical protein
MDSRKAPRFLTILCLLSLVGGIMSIKSAVTSLFYSDGINEDEIAFNLNMEGNEQMPSYIQKTMDSVVDFWLMKQEYSVPLQSSTILLSLLSLFGVFLMYRLNSKGFIYYAIANLLLIIIPFFYFFNNFIGQLFIAAQFFISALFILLYATQLKYMVKNKEPLKL